MRVGLIDVDGHNFPNIALMKLSSWHKAQGDEVEWYDYLTSDPCDLVYMSKIFSFSPDYPWPIEAKEIRKGGSGYCISLVDGKEVFDKSKDVQLPAEVEHSFPDYELYWDDDLDFEINEKTGKRVLSKRGVAMRQTAYGFMSRGCPRGCDFCHVATKEGKCAYKVADLKEFWNGQKYIQLCDPNTLACPDWKDILQQLIDSSAYVEFNQGVDVRLITPEKAAMLAKVKISGIHFAFDRYQDKDIVMPKLRELKKATGWGRGKVQVYVLCNFDTTMEQNLERVYFLRSLDFCPCIMLYNKASIPKGSELNKLARWCNNRAFFWKYSTFEEFVKANYKHY